MKPYMWTMLIVFALLFAQAMCELYLPNYMSDIVNVGLQQSGFSDAAPEHISAAGRGFIEGFMTDDEKALVDEYFFEDKLGSFMRLKGCPELERAFEDASTKVVTAAQAMASRAGTAMPQEMDMSQMDIEKIYPLAPMLHAQDVDVSGIAPEMKKQYAIALSRGYYQELGMDMTAKQRNYILLVGAKMLLIALLAGLATVLVGLISSKMASGIARKLRLDVFNKVASFSEVEMNRFGASSLITRTTNDIQQVQGFVQMGTRMILFSPIMCIGGIVMALQKSPSMSWILALAGIVLCSLIGLLMSIAMPKFKIMQKTIDKLNLVAREHLSGLMVIKAFGTTKFEEQRFEDANENLTGVQLFVNRLMSLMMPMMTLIMSGTSLLIMWVGARQIAQSHMQVGDMMAFMQYASQIIMSFLFMSMIFVFAPRASVSMARIADVLETVPVIQDPESPKALDDNQAGVVEFDHVSFRYENAEADALEDISFIAKPGETTALIGSTGSGKSTVVNLILRFFDATGGTVKVGGVDVREVSQKALRDKIGYVPQKGVLMSGTIESNLRYGNPDADDGMMQQAAAVAQALDFIEAKEESFDSEIAQGGDNVSGGQKQRLAIARALMKHPDILIFDDSFSALDFKTDVNLRQSLNEYANHATRIIVAQRVSTILHAEQILVMDNGKIIGRGTHRELMASCPEYQEIAGSQLSKEELA